MPIIPLVGGTLRGAPYREGTYLAVLSAPFSRTGFQEGGLPDGAAGGADIGALLTKPPRATSVGTYPGVPGVPVAAGLGAPDIGATVPTLDAAAKPLDPVQRVSREDLPSIP